MKLAWAAELAEWRPDLTAHVVRSGRDPVPSVDVIITNYESLFWTTFDRPKEEGKKRKRIIHKAKLPQRQTLIVDESHYVKTPESVRTDVVCDLIAETPRVRLLSGTPVVNRPIELWSLLYTTKTTKLGWWEFGKRYCNGWKTPWGNWDFSGASNLDELHKLLEPVMLRLTKAQVLPQLPPKTWKVVELDLPVDNREKQFRIEDIERNPEPIAFEALPDILHMNAQRKLPMAIQHIKDALESTQKVVVFAHHTDIVGELLSGLADYNPVKVVGGMKSEDRHASVQRFQNDPACRVFVGNIKAAGVGLTLTAASHVIFVEASWTPADLDQAADRCHRIGQKDHVLVEILTINQSIDAHMLHTALRKMEIINAIIKDTHMTTLNNALIAVKLRELADLFDAQDPKSAAAPEAASGQPTAKAKGARTKTDAEKTPSAPSVEDQPQASTAATTDPKPAAASSEPEAAAASTASSSASVTIDEVREALAKLIDAGKRDVALKILKDHGAAKVGELVESKFDSVIKSVDKALL